MQACIRHILILTLGLWAVLCGDAWADTVETALMPGQVIEGHAKWEEDCTKCHKRFDKAAQTTLCLECHKDVRKDVDAKQGLHGRFQEQRACKDCHTEHKGRTENIAPMTEQTFDHERTDFRLRGAHANAKKVECKSCHKSKTKYREAPSDCFGCHKKDDQHNGKAGTACNNCHTDLQWKDIRFDHDKTRYKLRNKHAEVACKDCHANNRYKDTPLDCYSCHKKDDKHKGKAGPGCADCHADRNWKEIRFDHDTTRYKLRNKHAEVACKDCHANDRYQNTPLDCYSCHKKDDKHKGQEGTKCEECHNDRSWKKAPFDHNKSRFPLMGKHAAVECKECHLTPAFKDTPLDCYACHKKDDTHKGAYGEKCAACHAESDWKTITFDHDLHTRYPLRGRHLATKCESCHKGHLYKDKTPTDCATCHKKDDPHKGRYGDRCERCHTEREWNILLFTHDRDTAYLLKGYHRKTKCDRCHTGMLYKDKTPTNCAACHKKDDVHRSNFGETCDKCHGEQTWKAIAFDHDRDTTYPLLGRHRTTACESCHTGRLYKDKTPAACYACHKSEDVHRRKLGTECQDCHSLRDWKLWDFDHNRRTTFKLDGGHKGLDCYACHTERMDKKVKSSSACVSCHKKDDKHEGSFGSQCERCHETTLWKTMKPGTGVFRGRP
ncbi:MAG: hypothetical protein RI101_10045 [Nitrospira sp.]|nr:hypothetical protein [Nitrospira sp.]